MGKRCVTVTCGASKKSRGTGLVLGSLFGVLLGAIRVAGGALAERLKSLTERRQGRIRRAADVSV